MDYVSNFLTYLAVERGYSCRTIGDYASDLRGFRRYLSHFPKLHSFEEVTSSDVRGWMMFMMEEGLSPTSVNRRLSALRSFYRYMMLMQYVGVDPTQHIKGPRRHKSLPFFLREDQVNRLLDDIVYPDGFLGCRDRTILLTFYLTGVRLSELQAMDERDIDAMNAKLAIHGKRNKMRFVPMSPELTQTLLSLCAKNAVLLSNAVSDRPLFMQTNGRRMTKAQISQMVKFYLAQVTTIKKRSPHILRHTFATVMLNHEAGLEVVKEMLGHESLTTTEIYTHTNFEELKKHYKKAHPRS